MCKIIFTLKEYLDSRQITRYWLSKNSGVSISAVENIYKNKTRRIDFSTLEKICSTLDCEISDILHLVKGDE